ncbi:MAG: CPBP family intramembrane metalloprotease, partial [Ktedonobacteraceae bacterium]|nr:CPBP family intramembrane metalloprotease [Ktedonobacteraceae bacterium]
LWLLLQFVVFEGNGVLNLSHFALPLLNAFYQNAIGTIVGIFIIQAVVAVGLMRLMGARWSELGFSKGYRSWSVVALWSTPWIVAALIALLLGHATVPLILGNLLISFFIAAIPEEFLFRGVLMTRIMQLSGSMQWSIGLSALLFGLSHLSINIHNQGGNVPAAIALTLLNFVFTGVVSAVIFQRTRSLLAGVALPYSRGRSGAPRAWPALALSMNKQTSEVKFNRACTSPQ